jgi:hypothetical protein
MSKTHTYYTIVKASNGELATKTEYKTLSTALRGARKISRNSGEGVDIIARYCDGLFDWSENGCFSVSPDGWEQNNFPASVRYNMP